MEYLSNFAHKITSNTMKEKKTLAMATIMATIMATPAAATPADEPGYGDEEQTDSDYDSEDEEVSIENFGLTQEDVEAFIATDSVVGSTEGSAIIPGANASLRISEGMRFIGASDAQKLLEFYWGNAEDTTVLGALVPADATVMNDIQLAYILYYSGNGYISDDDANDIDYDDLLKDMQETTRTYSDTLETLGYPRQELIGWAKIPSYDSDRKILRWAKHLKFTYSDGEESETLNYDVRILGRYGYVMMQAISTMEDADEVIAKGDKLSAQVNFDKDYRYQDFDEATDNVSDWTIGGLVAGAALASKTGLLAKIGLLLAKGWKLILVAVAAIGALFTKLKKGTKEDKTANN